MAGSAAKIAELESALRAVEKERDELAADVERLCLQSGSTMFDPSYVLTERLRCAESEVKQLRQQLSASKEERDNILEELQQARSAQISSDKAAAAASELSKSLMRDKEFFKERAVKVMAERDQEIEAMRAEALASEARLREVQESLELAQAANQDQQGRLSGLQTELDRLRQRHLEEQQVAQSDAETELRRLRDAVQALEEGTQKLKDQLVEAQADASHTHKLLKQAHKIEDQLTCQVRELQVALAAERQQHSSGSQSPQFSPGASSRSSPGSAGAVAAAAGAVTGGERPPRAEAATQSQFSPSSSLLLAVAERAAEPRLSPRLMAPSPRGGGGTPGLLSAATEAVVTVTAAEAAPPGQNPEEPTATASAAPGLAGAELEAAPSPPTLSPSQAVAETVATVPAAAATHVSLVDRVRGLEAALAQARDELTLERAVHEDEREQLQVLRTMAHDFKIKLAQATQEKVEALMRAAQREVRPATLANQPQQQQQQQAASAVGGGGVGQPLLLPSSSSSAVVVPQRQGSSAASSERSSSRELGRSPGSSHTFPAPSAHAASAGAGGGQAPARSSWASWLGGGGGGWYGISTLSTASVPSPSPVAAAATNIGESQNAASVASEEGCEADGSGAAAAVAAAAAAAAHAATVEAAEGRGRRLAAQLERVRSQLATIDRVAGQVGRCEARLRSCAALLWSSREEDAPRRWAALSDLTRLAEEAAAMRAEAGLPPGPVGDLPPVVPLALAEADAASTLRNLNSSHSRRVPGSFDLGDGSSTAAAAGGSGSGGEYDSSLVCTRESGGVQRRVAEVLLGSLEFGVRSLEQYNHHSALSSVLCS